MANFPFESKPNLYASDTEVDNDGLVGIDSALGVSLGSRDAWYFDHTKTWTIPNRGSVRGSWYRIPRGPWDFENHDSIKFNAELGAYLRRELIERAGPVCSARPRSSWDRAPGQFDEDRPKIVVLVHGKTSKPGGVPPSTNPSGDPKIGEYNSFFGYWGYDFVANLVGDPVLRTLSGRTVGEDDWTTSFLDTPDASDHFLTAGRRRSRRQSSPNVHVMITYRDGSESLIAQTASLADQIYRLYEEVFGKSRTKPHLILLGHSMGGLVSRCLLTAPDVRISGGSLSSDDRRKAGAICDNTLFLATLSSPHEGSALADKVCNIGSNLQLVDTWFDGLYEDLALDPLQWSPYVAEKMNSTHASTQDLRTAVWHQLNREALAPHLAARSDSSLVPVYCLGSRSPGGPFFHDPNTLAGGINPAKITFDRVHYNAIGQVMFDGIVSEIPGAPQSWGKPHPDATGLDLVRRTTQRELAPLHVGAVRSGLQLLGDIHPIAGVGAIAADVAFSMMTNVPYYLRHEWEILGPVGMVRVLIDLGKNGAEVLAYLLDGYTDDFADAAAWMQEAGVGFSDIVRSLIDEQAATYHEIAVMIRDRMNRGIDEIADAFRDAGVSSFNTTMLLANVFQASCQSIAVILSTWGKSATETLTRLKPHFGVTEILLALRGVYQIQAATAANLLLAHWGTNGRQAGLVLRQVGYLPFDVAGAMLTQLHASYREVAEFLVYDNSQTPIDAARMLRDLGVSAGELVQILRDEFGRPILEIATILKNDWQKGATESGSFLLSAGFGLGDIVGALKSEFQASARTVARFLKNEARQTWQQAASLMKSAEYSALNIARRLKEDFRVSYESIVGNLKDLFDLGKDEVRDLLTELGLPDSVVETIVNALFPPIDFSWG